MKFHIKTSNTSEIPIDCRVVFVSCIAKKPYQLFFHGKTTGQELSEFISTSTEAQHFEARAGDSLTLHIHHDRHSHNIILLGVGEMERLDMQTWLTVMAMAGREVKKIRCNTVEIVTDAEIEKKVGAPKMAEGIAEGMLLGTYTFTRYKKQEKKEHEIETVAIVSDGNKKELEEGIRFGELFSRATIVARDLVNEPSSVTTPSFLADYATSIARNNPSITCKVLGKNEMKKLGMGGILGIAKGSEEEPKLITLRYQPPPRFPELKKSQFRESLGRNKTIVLVGKGVTFDSGGLSLKSQDGMESMKIDMAGAAAVLGVFSVLSELHPSMNIIGVIPAVENMPSGKAIKPGDIVRTYNGKTIEIISTDAEGRVILADALAWAGEKFRPDAMIDLATLTGACMIALGEDIAGLFSNDSSLSSSMRSAAASVGERVWELPLEDSYNDLLKSDTADIRNVTRKRYGGAITAALFLKAFVPPTTAWAHLDIAGPAVAEKDTPLLPVGGTGFGVRTLLSFVTGLSVGKKMR